MFEFAPDIIEECLIGDNEDFSLRFVSSLGSDVNLLSVFSNDADEEIDIIDFFLTIVYIVYEISQTESDQSNVN